MKKEIRDPYFDFLRGLAIAAVVGIHTVKADFDYDSVIGFFTVSLRQAIGCAVPVFLAVSGYFLCRKEIYNKAGYLSFLKRQIPTVYLPCLVWSLPWLIMAIWNGKSLAVTLLLYFGCGLSVMYFIAVIIQCYIALPVLKKINFPWVIICLLISLLASAANLVYNIIPGVNLPLIVYGGPIPMLGAFFVIGYWLGQKTRNYSIQLVLILYVVTLLLSIVETYLLYIDFGIQSLGLKVTTQMNSFVTILLIFHPQVRISYKDNIITRFFHTLGRHSFIIYLSHCLLLTLVVSQIPLLRDYWLSSWLLGLFLSWVFAEAMIKYIPHKYWRYIGLR